MFEHLTEYKRILVTGPQRSGTRACAHMIAHDTGHTYIDETEFNVDSMCTLMWIMERENTVVQCPALMRYVDRIQARCEGMLVVLMDRSLNDITASQERIGWGGEWIEKLRYPEYDDMPISLIKYLYWSGYQRDRCNYVRVEYESLSDHPLWVPKERRRDFDAFQWRDSE